jgi:glucosamine--fructose-6-phosphate aminotransferase (isomerizing)
MLANILEQPAVAARCLAWDLCLPPLPPIDRVIFTACGSSRHAGMVARSWWQSLLHLPAHIEDAADGYPVQVPPRSLIYLLSQSGQTQDVLDVAARLSDIDCPLWGMTNAAASPLHQITHYTLQTPAGAEQAVAATKTFSAQLLLLLRVAFAWHDRANLPHPTAIALQPQLSQLPEQIQRTLQLADPACQQLAAILGQTDRLILLGAGINTAIALEGALKLKETVYVHAEGLSSGDFMHGPIALVEPGFPVMTIAIPHSATYAKTITQAQRIKSYGAYLVGITTEDAIVEPGLFDQILPIAPIDELLSPLLTVLPLQLLAYYMARARGLNVDQPRHLTKFI